MALDFQTAMNQYGFVGVLVQNTPELLPLFQQAVNEEWDSSRFERELANTAWYKRLNENGRQLALLQATDPATYSEQIENKKQQIDIAARQMGVQGIDLTTLAYHALANGWDDTQLRAYIVDAAGWMANGGNGGFTGQAGEIESHIRSTYAAYGYDNVGQWIIQGYAKDILAGRQTLGGADNEIRNAAKALYPAFAEQIDSGKTLADLADPYVQTMANTLELDGAAIKLNDPAIKKALQGPDGKTPMSMWQFERQLKDDARWQYTKNAKNEAYSVLQQVGNDWGLGG